MGTVTLAEINQAIHDKMALATGLSADLVQDHDELTDGISDTPTLQVYWHRSNTDPRGNAGQSTFGAGVRQKVYTFYADLLAKQRMAIGEDMAALLPLVDAIHDVLEAETGPSYFGLSTVKSIQGWTAEQVMFDYADVPYIGTRFVIPVRVF